MRKNNIRFIEIPFQIDPLGTVSIVLITIMKGITPGLLILAIERFINEGVSALSLKQDSQQLLLSFAFLILAYLLNPACKTANEIVSIRLSEKLGRELNRILICKEAALQYRYLEDEQIYDVIARLGKKVEEEFFNRMKNVLRFFQILLNYLSMALCLASVSVWLMLIMVILLVPVIYIGYVGGKRKYDLKKEIVQKKRWVDYLEEVLTTKETASERSMFQYGNHIAALWHRQFSECAAEENKVDLKNTGSSEAVGLFVNSVFCFILMVVVYYVAAEKIAIGILIALVSQMIEFAGVFRWGIVSSLQNWIDNRQYMEDWNSIMNLPEQANLEGIQGTHCAWNKIELIDVTFSYPGSERPVLQKLNLTIEKGKSYCIVGENGSGKTTLIKLLLGFYEEYEGQILLDGVELRRIPYSDRRALFGIVFQNFTIYPVSIRENIEMGNYPVPVSEERIHRIVKQLEMETMLEKLPEGIHTRIGRLDEQDTELSGGEAQKIAIARCLCSQAPCFILDEPTSALDPMLESDLFKLFQKVGEHKTTIMISHRLGAAAGCDQVILIRNGNAAGIGSHEELLLSNSYYADMYEKQRGWYCA